MRQLQESVFQNIMHSHVVPHLLCHQGALCHLCNHEDPLTATRNILHMVFRQSHNL